jgi:uncharacterized Zn ribbon protein
MSKHKGPVCKQCGSEFYYDYIPQRHDFSGYCRECYADWERIRAAAQPPADHQPTEKTEASQS